MDIQETQKDVTSEDTDKFEEEPEIIHDNTEISLRPISNVPKMEDNKNRKSIFNEPESKSDIQENINKKVEAISFVQENDVPRKKTEKKVQINEEQAVATLSEAARESELANNQEMQELKRCSQDEEDDITACESDAEDSDKDCMLDLTNMDQVQESKEPTRKPPPFGFSLSKHLRRRYIVILGVLLGALMLGIIMYGIIRATSSEEEPSMFEASTENYSTESPESAVNEDEPGNVPEASTSTVDQAVETVTPLGNDSIPNDKIDQSTTLSVSHTSENVTESTLPSLEV